MKENRLIAKSKEYDWLLKLANVRTLGFYQLMSVFDFGGNQVFKHIRKPQDLFPIEELDKNSVKPIKIDKQRMNTDVNRMIRRHQKQLEDGEHTT